MLATVSHFALEKLSWIFRMSTGVCCLLEWKPWLLADGCHWSWLLLVYFDYEIFRFFFSTPFSIPCCLFGIWMLLYGARPATDSLAVSLIRYLTLMAFVRSCSDPKVLLLLLLLRFLGHFNICLSKPMVGKVFSEINYYNTTLHLSKSYVCFWKWSPSSPHTAFSSPQHLQTKYFLIIQLPFPILFFHLPPFFCLCFSYTLLLYYCTLSHIYLYYYFYLFASSLVRLYTFLFVTITYYFSIVHDFSLAFPFCFRCLTTTVQWPWDLNQAREETSKDKRWSRFPSSHASYVTLLGYRNTAHWGEKNSTMPARLWKFAQLSEPRVWGDLSHSEGGLQAPEAQCKVVLG